MNRLIVPPLPAASRPSNRITSRCAGRLDPVLQLQQLDLQQPLVVLVLVAAHPLVVRVALAPGVDRLAVGVDQHRVVIVVVDDPVVTEAVNQSERLRHAFKLSALTLSDEGCPCLICCSSRLNPLVMERHARTRAAGRRSRRDRLDSLMSEVEPVAAVPPAVYESGPAARPRTLVDIFAATVAKHPHAAAIDDGRRVRDLPPAGRRDRRAQDAQLDRRPGSASATGSASGSPPAPPSCTSRSSPCCRSAPRTCRSTPTTRTNAPSWCSARRTSAPILGDGRSLTMRRRTARRDPAGPVPTTTRGSSSRPARPASRRASRSRTGPPPRSSTPRPHCSWSTSRSVPHDRVLAGLSVAFDASCEEMWLAWRHGACLVPAPRSLVRTGVDLGPWLVEQRITDRVDGADARRAVAGRRARGGPAADLRRRGLPAGARRPDGGRGPRGLEHVRADRGDRGRVRRPAGRRRAGAHRAAADRLAARRRRRARRAGADGRHRRAGHRRRRPGPLPRQGQGRREVQRAAGARLGARVPQRRPRARRPGGAVVPRPRRRAGQARRPADRTRRGRRRAAGAARRRRCRVRDPAHQGAATRSWSATWCRPTAAPSTTTRRSARLREQLPAALVPLLAVVDDLPTRTSGKIDRAALPWPLPTAHRRRRAPTPTVAHADRKRGSPKQWWEILGIAVERARRRLLQQRRRQPDRGAAHRPHPDPVPAGLGRRRLPEPEARRARPRSSTRTSGAHRPRRDVAPTPRRAGRDPDRADGAAADARRAALGGRRRGPRQRPGDTCRRSRGYRTCPGGGSRPAGSCCSARPGRIAISAGGARLLLRGVRPGDVPARRRRAPAAVVRRAARRVSAASTSVVGCRVHDAVRHRRSARTSAGRRPALARRRSPAC